MPVETVTRYLGPPATKTWSIITRIFQLATFILVAIWVLQYLGGVALHPKELNLRSNDTGGIFNWHPLLMTLAFPVLMGEAVMAYRTPMAPNLEHGQRKLLHMLLNAFAVVAAIFGVIAAFRSHTLKRPLPTPNLYSPHSYLGITTLVLLGMQFLLGFAAYFWPAFTKANKEALLPWHHFLGRATLTLGLATMAVGLQEKVGFVVAAKKLSGAGLYSGYVRLPAAIEVFLALTGMLVLFHHVPGPANRRADDALLADVLPSDAA